MTALLVWLCLLSGDGGSFSSWPAPAAAAARDSGTVVAPPSRPTLKPEDQEVVQNLELLEHLDETADLDLLQELSAER